MSVAVISVVIPALNERPRLEGALRSAHAPGVERIVVDGGSSDGTAQLARRLGAERVLVAERGRARQMDAGYRAARGEAILFLHADTRLEAGWADALRSALEQPGVSGGAFLLRFDDSEGRIYRVIERGARLRSRLARLPYGDQAIFARREVLERLGGIPHAPIFEDLDLVRAIRRSGRLVLLPLAARTSARRYERAGPLRAMLRNWLALGAYLLNVDRERVAGWYGRRPDR